jgi:hypothetical protein
MSLTQFILMIPVFLAGGICWGWLLSRLVIVAFEAVRGRKGR